MPATAARPPGGDKVVRDPLSPKNFPPLDPYVLAFFEASVGVDFEPDKRAHGVGKKALNDFQKPTRSNTAQGRISLFFTPTGIQ